MEVKEDGPTEDLTWREIQDTQDGYENPVAGHQVREDIYSWETVMFLYNAALKKVRTKMDILNDEFGHIHNYNPIEYIKSRIKTPESIVKKLRRDGYDSTIENMVKYVNDIAGIRVVCSFTSDIYRIADMIRKQKDLTILSVKDYFSHPKENGYKSYHMLVTIPIYMSTGVVDTKVEIQIRTIAMDFWASLEHKIYYKFEGNAPAYIYDDLRSCAEIVSNLDAKMLQLNEAIIRANEPKPSGQDMEDEGFMSDSGGELTGDIESHLWQKAEHREYPVDQAEDPAGEDAV